MAMQLHDATRKEWLSSLELYILDLGLEADKAVATEAQLRRRVTTAQRQLRQLSDTLKLDPNVPMLEVVDTLAVVLAQLDPVED